MDERYIRQEAFFGIGKKGQKKLGNSKVAVIGLGALGTVTANNLTRAGVGFLRLIDRDYVELNNLQRQSLYREDDAEKAVPKAAAACEHLKEVNSSIQLEAAITDVNSSTIDSLIEDVDLVMDATDNFQTRQLMNEACCHLKKPWIYGGALGAVGMTMNFLQENGPCLCCLMGNEGGIPGSEPTCASAGILNTTTNIIASLQSTEALKILTGSKAVRKQLFVMDLWENTFELIAADRDPGCPVCGRRQYRFYGKPQGLRAASLCGRNSVQIIPERQSNISFQDFAKKLEPLGTVSCGPYTLDFDNGNIGIKLFQNGRAIIRHVSDEKKALSLYAEYIGL